LKKRFLSLKKSLAKESNQPMKCNKILLFYCLLLFFASLAATAAVNAERGFHVECDSDYIAVDIKEVPLKDLLSLVQEQSGIWFRGDETLLKRSVTIQFDKMTMTDGLKRILLSVNHAMVFDKAGKLRGIVLVDAGKGPRSGAEAVAADGRGDPLVLEISDEHDSSPYAFREPFLIQQDRTAPPDRPSPSVDPPPAEKIAREGPGAGTPPERLPGTGQNQKPPARSPGSDPPKFVTPPMPDKPAILR